ncbi:MAG: hypothetical protein WHT82_02125 [Limisphaera sp.]
MATFQDLRRETKGVSLLCPLLAQFGGQGFELCTGMGHQGQSHAALGQRPRHHTAQSA